MSAHRKPAAKRAAAKPWKRNYNPALDALTKRAPKDHTAAMRKAFVRRFGALTTSTGYGRDRAEYHDRQFYAWCAFKAGAVWQRRQRRGK